MVKKEKEYAGYRPKVSEKIICEHKGCFYQAKVNNTRKDPNSTDKNADMQFHVHYLGWSKTWDEWVDETRIHELTDANTELLGNVSDQTASKSKGSSTSKKKIKISQQNDMSNLSTASVQSESKDGSITLEPHESIVLDQEIKIKIPDELKNWLIDDDNCIKNKKLSLLPARSTINMILKDFINHKKMTSKAQAEKEAIIHEMTLGIRDYFNVMLGAHLLYKFERLQYQTLLKDEGKDVDLANHYGVIHLIRLMTKIGKPLAATVLDSQNIQTIVNYIQELLKFISKQSNLFDLERNYFIAPPEYIKNAMK